MNLRTLLPPRHLAGAAIALSIGLATPLLLTGCAGPVPTDYARQSPKLDLKQYFNGQLLAHGIVTDRSGRVTQRFVVQLTGRWQGDTGTLDERFTYADGRQETRVWTLQRGADGRYSGRAADVVGQADGQAAGNALNWRYTLQVPVDGRLWELDFDDWMFLVDEHVMINRAVMSKFGIRLGEVLLSFQRLPG
jgi:5-hydroxyisourate hydrolase-like protein (transthyretin family)